MTVVADGPAPGHTGAPFPRLDLAELQTLVQHAAHCDGETLSETELITEMARIQRLQNSLNALQTLLARAFGRRHVAAHTATGQVEPEKLERGIVSQVASACGTSPHHGRKIVVMGRDLCEGLDHIRNLHTAGRLRREQVAPIITATTDLDADERARVDELLAGHDLPRMGVKKIADLARACAATVAPDTFRARTDTARTRRRVTLRPGVDGMTWLTAHLPVEQGVACIAALEEAWNHRQVDPAPLTRTRGQVHADTLVERLTGQETAEHVNIEVQVVVPYEALVDPDSPLPAEVPGHGPVPVHLLGTARGRRHWRRLVTRKGIVVGGDTKKRRWTKFLDMLIRARDRYRCTAAYCDAPIRHLDHIVQVHRGGPTEFWHGHGVCALHNYVRELPGWNVTRTDDGVETTTPTGHTYLSRPDPRE